MDDLPGDALGSGPMTDRAVLVTGGSRGIGAAIVRAFAGLGDRVAVHHRDSAARAAGIVAGLPGGGHTAVQADLAYPEAVRQAVDQAAAALGGLDVLVNNAGIEGRTPDNGVIDPADETAEHMQTLFDTNVFGIIRMLHAFLPLLLRSPAPVVVNLSSGLSKTADLANPDGPVHFYPGVAYPASKTAVNTLTVQYAKAFPGIKINAVDPGYTATDLNGRTGTQTVEEGAEIVVRMAQLGPDGPTGGYFDASGPVAW
jgi:NAD(P)-dependent dehydrogenase (short-subunit alcohol dehydrogenase family)